MTLFPGKHENDPRVQALIETVRSSEYRRILQDLPGYDTRKSGELQYGSA